MTLSRPGDHRGPEAGRQRPAPASGSAARPSEHGEFQRRLSLVTDRRRDRLERASGKAAGELL